MPTKELKVMVGVTIVAIGAYIYSYPGGIIGFATTIKEYVKRIKDNF